MAANRLAKSFAIRRGLISGENTHVGNTLPRFIDAATGKDFPKDYVELPNVLVQKTVPSYVKSLEWDDRKNLPYYKDEKTGDLVYVDKGHFYSSRFQPNRGKR